ncbi:MAG: hypothetical protein JSV35_00045 [Candidatus Bathyarchaeota archaeon]|nr:MAG: hypothetical protein JSV35_00045 [Candidatus Bathyarchaeota archaeon]
MTRSKLERYLSVLEALVTRPLEFESALYQVGEKLEIVTKCLSFLCANQLVDRLPLDEKRVVYAITDKGLGILNVLQGQEDLDKYRYLMLVLE